MPRTARASAGNVCYHVINRGNARARVFHDDADYRAFVALLGSASDRLPMRLLAYCLMPNHFHLILWPFNDGDLSTWMRWLLTAQVRRHHRRHGTDGHLWQGRFKAFPIQQDEHLFTVLRYVERNPLRAELVARAEDWPWSSLHLRFGTNRGGLLHPGPLARPPDWCGWVNQPVNQVELDALRRCVNRGTPWGNPHWAEQTATRLGLEATLRPRGRPPRPKNQEGKRGHSTFSKK